MSAPPMGTTPMERRLHRALSDLLRAATRAEVIMRRGNCPKCGAEPVNEDGTWDEDFSLSMCLTDDWSEFNHAVVLAEEAHAGIEVDLCDPTLRQLETSLVAIDARLAGSHVVIEGPSS